MTKSEFNTRVDERVDEFSGEDATKMLNKIKTQDLYRFGGISSMTFGELLREIAQADVLGLDLVDDIDINEEIKHI